MCVFWGSSAVGLSVVWGQARRERGERERQIPGIPPPSLSRKRERVELVGWAGGRYITTHSQCKRSSDGTREREREREREEEEEEGQKGNKVPYNNVGSTMANAESVQSAIYIEREREKKKDRRT